MNFEFCHWVWNYELLIFISYHIILSQFPIMTTHILQSLFILSHVLHKYSTLPILNPHPSTHLTINSIKNCFYTMIAHVFSAIVQLLPSTSNSNNATPKATPGWPCRSSKAIEESRANKNQNAEWERLESEGGKVREWYKNEEVESDQMVISAPKKQSKKRPNKRAPSSKGRPNKWLPRSKKKPWVIQNFL